MPKAKQAAKQYSAAERRAYYMGCGAWIGFGKAAGIKKAVAKMTAKEKESFYNGFDDSATKRKNK